MKSRFFVNPYLFSLITLAMILLLISTFFVGSYYPVPIICALVLVGVCFIDGFNFWGIVEISDSAIVFRAPLKKAIIFPRDQIQRIGIDWVFLSVRRQYWIYISKEEIPQKYDHCINQMPINQAHARMLYSKKLAQRIEECLSVEIKKQ